MKGEHKGESPDHREIDDIEDVWRLTQSSGRSVSTITGFM